MEAKWEETVMKGEEMSEEIQRKTKKWSICNPEFIEDVAGVVAQKQAELSFKAGYKYALEGAVIEGAFDSIKQEGRKEVVEWIQYHGGSLDGSRSEWQAQCKDWGIDV